MDSVRSQRSVKSNLQEEIPSSYPFPRPFPPYRQNLDPHCNLDFIRQDMSLSLGSDTVSFAVAYLLISVLWGCQLWIALSLILESLFWRKSTLQQMWIEHCLPLLQVVSIPEIYGVSLKLHQSNIKQGLPEAAAIGVEELLQSACAETPLCSFQN